MSVRLKMAGVAGFVTAVLLGAGFTSPAMAGSSDSTTRAATGSSDLLLPVGYYGARKKAREALTREYGANWSNGFKKSTKYMLRLSETRVRIYYSFRSAYRGKHKHGYVLIWRIKPGDLKAHVKKG